MIKKIQYNTSQGNALMERLLSRSQQNYKAVAHVVEEIIENVRKNGDDAVFHYTKKFDGFACNKENFLVTEAEIEEGYNQVDKEFVTVISRAAQRIRDFHSRQKANSWFNASVEGEFLGQVIRPMETAGIYVPGGKAAYPSSVLMNIIPAQVAGVENIIMATPPGKDGKVYPNTLVAAKEAGVGKIFKMGGAQAIAALAFGTQSVPKVDKIAGPGNIYVASAKRSVYGYCSIDSIAGPSEILVIADGSANPVYVAADMLSQAEHDEMASAILLTTSATLAEAVGIELEKQMELLERKEIIGKSLQDYGAIVIVDNLDQAVELANKIAPEHLEVCTEQPYELLSKIKNAGAIFLGHFTPEPVGDYVAGPNHILPTGGTARFFSPLSVDDFVKKSSVLSFSKDALHKVGNDTIYFATAEGLTAHANAVRVRMNG